MARISGDRGGGGFSGEITPHPQRGTSGADLGRAAGPWCGILVSGKLIRNKAALGSDSFIGFSAFKTLFEVSHAGLAPHLGFLPVFDGGCSGSRGPPELWRWVLGMGRFQRQLGEWSSGIVRAAGIQGRVIRLDGGPGCRELRAVLGGCYCSGPGSTIFSCFLGRGETQDEGFCEVRGSGVPLAAGGCRSHVLVSLHGQLGTGGP